jgi:hypothetical protein
MLIEALTAAPFVSAALSFFCSTQCGGFSKKLSMLEAETDIRIGRMRVALVSLLLFCPIALQARGVFVTVTNINDSGPGSLRQALVDAHDGDFINFATALFRQTITLSSAELVIEKDITINGPGPDRLALSRSSNTPLRIFHVMPGHTVAIQGLMITGGGTDDVRKITAASLFVLGSFIGC